jgi:hypothetical protein
MKPAGKLFNIAFVFAATLAAMSAMSAMGAPAVAVPTNTISPRSVFIIPSNSREGRDPFFPSSLRPYVSAVPKAATGGDITALRFGGISGPPGHRLVIINNHTFAAGDEGEVITSQGRMHIHCVGITDTAVVIETEGQRVELHYSDKP